MDELVSECEKLWTAVPWLTSPLHGVPRETRKTLLLDFLSNHVPPPCYDAYTASCHPLSECPRVMSLVTDALRDLERLCPDLNIETPMLSWFKGPLYEEDCCLHAYTLFDLLCSLTTTDDIHQTLSIYGRDFYAYILVDHAIEVEGGLERLSGFEINIFNFLLQCAPESPPAIFERLRAKGVHAEYAFHQRNIHPRTVLWLHRHYPNLYETGGDIDHLHQLVTFLDSHTRSLAHLVLYVICLHRPLSPSLVAVILRKLMPPYTPMHTAIFDYIATEMENGRLSIDAFHFQESPGFGPCNRAMQVIMADEAFVRHHLMFFLRTTSITSDLDIDYWVLFFWKMGFISDHFEAMTCMTRRGIGADPRIIAFFCKTDPTTNSISATTIPFDKPFDVVLRNEPYHPLYAHLQLLQDSCSFFKSLSHPILFKPHHGLAEGSLDLAALLDHTGVKNLDATFRAILHHIYTGRLPSSLTVEAAADLNELAWYLGNERCVHDTTHWICHQYLTRFEDHFECDLLACPVCLCWRTTK
jgi:hypothetical protein